MRDLLSLFFLIVAMYYVWFLGIHFDWGILFEIVVLLAVSSMIFFMFGGPSEKKVWFRQLPYGWMPINWSGWSVAVIATCLVVLIFLSADINSHSVSDTFLNAFPFASLVVATAIGVAINTTGEVPVKKTAKRARKTS